jgi:type IV pilus assembly protein PilA
MSKLIRKSNQGFTLIELMIVVAIIGILAAIAIPNFLRFQLKAKSSEGKVNIAAIRTAEESFNAEFGTYVGVLTANPAGVPGATKAPFETSETEGENFEKLGWAPEGQVFFQYAVNYIPAAPTAYTITATADVDGNTVNQSWGYIKPFSAIVPAVGVPGIDVNCLGAGLPNPVTGGEPLFTTVGPCTSASGQSEF